jgi:hypothetical protein
MVGLAVDEPILPFFPRCSRLLQHGETVKAKRAVAGGGKLVPSLSQPSHGA